MDSKPVSFDDIDFLILETLVSDARVSWTELAQSLSLSPPAVAERVRKLEGRGVIASYHARLSPDAVGAQLLAFISVSLSSQKDREAFLKRVTLNPAILECHHTTGDDDFLLKVRVSGTAELEALLTNDLKRHAPGIRTRTTVALSSLKEDPLRVKR
jgi:Lrp/AsnC family transcriptional regulator, leucine-responsive regulatory protein